MDSQTLKINIKKHLGRLYFLRSVHIQAIMKRLDSLPEEGLKQFLAVLEEGLLKQDEFLEKMNTLDPQFNAGLKQFLNKSYKDATTEVTEQEHEDAEKLLDQL